MLVVAQSPPLVTARRIDATRARAIREVHVDVTCLVHHGVVRGETVVAEEVMERTVEERLGELCALGGEAELANGLALGLSTGNVLVRGGACSPQGRCYRQSEQESALVVQHMFLMDLWISVSRPTVDSSMLCPITRAFSSTRPGRPASPSFKSDNEALIRSGRQSSCSGSSPAWEP